MAWMLIYQAVGSWGPKAMAKSIEAALQGVSRFETGHVQTLTSSRCHLGMLETDSDVGYLVIAISDLGT